MNRLLRLPYGFLCFYLALLLLIFLLNLTGTILPEATFYWVLFISLLFIFFITYIRRMNPLMYSAVVHFFSPRHVPTLLLKGDAYLFYKRFDLALRDFERALELEPWRAECFIYHGKCLMFRQEYQQALQDFERALELKPTSHVAYNNKGWAYFELKEYDLAAEAYDRSVELSGKYLFSRQGRGLTYSRLHKWSEAVEDFQQALRLTSNPKYCSDIYYRLALVYHAMGEHQQAATALQQAAALTPRRSAIYGTQSLIYVYLGQYQRAVQASNRAMELQPRNDPAYNNRGKAYLGLGNLKQAEAHFAQAVQLDPLFVSHSWYLTWTRLCLGQEPDEDLAAYLETIASHNQGHHQAYACLGLAAWIRGVYEEALQAFAQSIQARTVQWDAYFWSGMVYLSQGNRQAAREAIQQALNHSLPSILLTPLYQVDPALHEEMLQQANLLEFPAQIKQGVR